ALTGANAGNGQLQVAANGTTFAASAPSSVITVLPVAVPSLTIDGNFSVAGTGTGVRRQHYVQLPANAGAGGVPVQVTVQGTGAQVSTCDPANPTSQNCTGGVGGSSTVVTVPQNQSQAYFDLIGMDTAAADVQLSGPQDVVTDANGAIYVADYGNYR